MIHFSKAVFDNIIADFAFIYLFAISLWNVHDRVEHDLPRINNSIGGWHHSFNLRVAITHPMIRRLVAKLLEEQVHNELLLEQVPARIPLPPAKKNYDTYANIFTIVNKKCKLNCYFRFLILVEMSGNSSVNCHFGK